MFYSRRINPDTQKVEVWECEWSNKGTGMAKKEFLRKAGDEEDMDFSSDAYGAADAVCWAPGRTIGNIAVRDRKSTRLNSSHRCISYAVFCLKKKIKTQSIHQ